MEDVIIRGGLVADGSGAPACRADVAVQGGVITAVGDLRGVLAARNLDAEGMTVSPGFIDAHAHSDTSFLRDSSYASMLYQGITTEVSGNCGDSPFPARPEEEGFVCASFDDFVRRFEREGYAMAVNQAMLVGHGSLRNCVIGPEDRAATPEEMEEMCRLLRRDLQNGAWGLSLGLEYAPGFFANQQELNDLGRVVRDENGIVTCHLRSEGLEIEKAVQELLDIGRASGVHVHISHIEIDNYRVHGRAPQIWAAVEAARKEGLQVTADLYPYASTCTTLTIRCPKWSLDGGDEALLSLLRGPRRQDVTEGIRRHYFSAERAETCFFCDDCGLWPEIVGRNLRQVAEDMLHIRDYAEAAATVIERTQAKASCIFFVTGEQDMLYFLSRDTSIGTDGWAMPGDPQKVKSKPHPRSFGAVAEFFRLARERKLCTLEEAVHRVTLQTALRFGMTDRGRIAPGMAADITVFDPQNIAPRATYLQPVQLAVGVRHVLVGGGIALLNGEQTEGRFGRFLRKKSRLSD